MLKKKRKIYILFAAELLCLLLLLPGCFTKPQLVQDFYGENLTDMMVPIEDHLEFCSEELSLLPGVYQIKVQADLASGQFMYVEMKADNAYYKSLLGNGVTVFAGDDSLEMSVYVRDKVDSAYVLCDFYGADPESLISLQIYWTNKGNRILLLLALVVFATVNFMLEFRRRILEGLITKKQQVVFWALTAGVLLAYFPYLTDYFSMGADTLFHLTRIAGLKETLAQGTSFPIRIQSHWCYDHGYAVSMFYGDLFLFIPAGLMLIGFPLMTAYKLFILILLAATVVISYHAMHKCVKDEYAALFGSLVYLLVPYHIFNIYNRGAIGELSAMTFLPLVFCGMYLLYTEDITSADYKKNKWYLIWGLTAILQSHIISTGMAVFFMLVFCAGLWKKTFRRETFIQFFQAAVITLLINMWFLLPLLYMMNADTYHLQRITSETLQEHGLYLSSFLQLLPNKGGAQIGMYNNEPVQVGAGVLMLLAVYILWSIRRIRKQNRNNICSVFALCSVATFVMSTRYFPWNMIMKLPIMGYIISSLQSPARWMVMASLFTALFASYFFLEVKASGGILIKTALGVAAVIMAISTVYHVNSIAFESGAVYLYEAEGMGTNNVGNGEYLLAEAGDFALDIHYHDPVADGELAWSDYTQSGTNVSLSLHNTADRILFMEIPLMGYKGYQIQSSKQVSELPYITEEMGAHGDLRIAVPVGYEGKISISYKGFPIFHIAEAVSVITLAAMSIIYLYHKRKKAENGIESGRN